MAKVTMPQLGESVAEGTIGRWLKQPGDAVAKYEPLLEVITDKVNAEVPSPYAGILREILVEEGATVPNNAEIAVIETADDAAGATPATETAGTATATAPEAALAAPTTESAERPTADAQPAGRAAPAIATAAGPQPDPGAAEEPGDPDARMTPAVRRLLREHGLSPAQVAGSGRGGRITREDVIAVAEGRGAPAAPPAAAPGTSAPARPAPGAPAATTPAATTGTGVVFPPGEDEVLLPMTQMRKGIAAQMTRALAAPHAYIQMEIDVTGLVRLRDRAKAAYQAREGVSLSFVPFVVKAAAEALRTHPTINAHWTDAGLVAKRRINVGVAVAVDDGLIVPVIRDVDQLSISGLNLAIADVSARARAGKLRIDDFGGGTFTVDNTGWLGTNLVMPIINVPEVAIVTMDRITKRAVVVETEDGDVIAIRSVMNMVMGIDHRANDGAGGAAFLRDVKAWLEAVGPETPIH